VDPAQPAPVAPRIIGRYALYDAIASGGMATVHLGRLVGAVGFSRPVAIKRLHPHYAKDPDFAAMFIDEARLAARVHHPNVVPMLDVVAEDGEIFLVMEYVHGESLSYLLRAVAALGKRLPEKIVGNIIANALHGLHAAHHATGEGEHALGIVHRDMSPQNVLVGTDGVARVLDFGVAKAVGKLHTTREGQIKGKLRYMAPEQILGAGVSPRTDLWAASVVLWEALTGSYLFSGDNDAALLHEVLEKEIPSPRDVNPAISAALAELVLAGLARDPAHRIGSAEEMAERLEDIVGLVSPREVGEWVQLAAKTRLDARAKHMADLETIAAIPSAAPAHTWVVQTPPALPGRGRLHALVGVAVAFAVAGAVWLSVRPATQSSTVVDAGTVASAKPEPDSPSRESPPTTASPREVPAPPPPDDVQPPPAKAPPRPVGAPPARKVPRAPDRGGFKVPLYGRD